MIQTRIARTAAAAPFGDDEDANAAVRTFARVAGLLAQECKRLADMKTSNLDLRRAQEARVADLRSEITSRAKAVHVDPDKFLAACIAHLEGKRGRKLQIVPTMGRATADDEDRRLQSELLDAEIAEANRKRLLDSAQQRFDDAVRAANSARARLSAYRTRERAAA